MSPEEIKALIESLKTIREIIESKPNEWLPVYAALGGAITGAVASFFPTYFLERYRNTIFSKQILNSLTAEIAALLEIIKVRGYHSDIKKTIELLESQPEVTEYSFTVHIPEHYSRVFQENCKNIGSINSKSSKQIVMFHQLIDAVVQDIKPGGLISLGCDIKGFKEIDQILDKAIQIGNKLISDNKAEDPI